MKFYFWVLACAGFFLLIFLVQAAIFDDDTQTEFNNGTYYRTFFNLTGNFVQLNNSFNFGNYTSKIFDAGSVSDWNNFSWISGTCYRCELPDNRGSDGAYYNNSASMAGNVLLAHLNELSGDIIDYSGFGHTGKAFVFEGDEYNALGKFNRSFDFEYNTDPTNGDAINFSRPSLLTNYGGALTLEAWVKPESFGNSQNNFPTIIDKDFSEQFSFYFSRSSSQGRLVADLVTTQNSYNVVGANLYSAGSWYHVVLTYSGSEVRIYVNGNVEGSTSATGNVATGTKDLIVGAGWTGGNLAFAFDGLIDEVAIYNRSLTQDEVLSHYERGVLELNLSVRSCDDSACSGESWNAISSPNVNLSVVDNRYFQYKSDFVNEVSGKYPRLHEVLIDYSIQNSAPTLNFVFPLNATYGASQMDLNYTASDDTLNTCWYSLDNGATNTTIACGQNASAISVSHGSHFWQVWANDSLGAVGSANVNFFVDLNSPILSIEFPSNGSYYSTNALSLNYTASDDTLNTCWYSLNNGATNTTIICGSDVGGLIASEGLNRWVIFANDTFGRENYNDSFFTVDTILPSVILTEPIGAKTSRTDVPIAFSVTDANAANCWYNVYRGIILEVANTSVSCAIGVDFFDVTVDANFVLTFYANDSAGNINSTNSSFSVSTSGGGSGGNSNGGGDSGSGGGGSGGGGGGGASSSADKKINVEFASLERILIKRGTQATANLLVTNTGKSFLNSCKLRFDGTGGEWFSSTQTTGLSSGEKFSFAVEVAVPDSAEPGEYNIKTVLACDEGETESSILIAPYRNQFEASIKNYEKDGTNLKVSYILQEFAGLEHEILIDYSLVDFDGVARYKGQEKVSLGARVTMPKEIIFTLPKDSFGEFKFLMELTDGVSQSKTEEEVFLPSGGLFTGFTLFENGKIKLSSFGVILTALIILAAGFILYRRFRRHSKKVEVGFGKKRKRKLIALDM